MAYRFDLSSRITVYAMKDENENFVARIQLLGAVVNGYISDKPLNEEQLEAIKEWAKRLGLVCPEQRLICLGPITPTISQTAEIYESDQEDQ